jgi:hypothetical protein
MTQSPTPTDRTQEDGARLNAMLDGAGVPEPSASLKRDILAAYDDVQQNRRSGFASLDGVFDRFRLASAAALAGVSVLGLTVGVLTANSSAALSPEDELYIYAEDAFDLALLEDEELDQWARE